MSAPAVRRGVAARSMVAPAITEREFQRQVVDLARIFGWDLVYHAQLAKWSEKGWPDLVLVRVRDRRLIFAELKTDKGRLTDRQEAVLEMLRSVSDEHLAKISPSQIHDSKLLLRSIEVHVWRPADLEEIAQCLR